MIRETWRSILIALAFIAAAVAIINYAQEPRDWHTGRGSVQQ